MLYYSARGQALKTCMQGLLSHANSKPSDRTAADSDANPFVSLQLLRRLEEPVAMQRADLGSYFALNERIVAAESCWFAAKVRFALPSKTTSSHLLLVARVAALSDDSLTHSLTDSLTE
jgi:hypothetical protein